jgi:PAS domain S-box-containing protein
MYESERFANATVDALSTHLAILDETGEIVAVNRAWREFAEANPPVLGNVCEGANYLSVCDTAAGPDSEEAKIIAARVRAIIRGEEKECALEYPCHSPKEERWFTVRVTRFSGDGAIRLVVAHENITERKHREEALRTSERRLRLFADNVSDVLWNIDLSGRFAYLSPSAEQMVGLKWEEGMQVPIADIVAPSSLPVVQEALQNIAAAAQRGQRIEISNEIELSRRDGATLWSEVVANASFDESGQLVGFSGVTRDITERKQSEKKLLEFKTAVEQALDGVTLTDLGGHVRFVNGAWAKMHGYSADELIGRHLGIFHTKEQLETEVSPFIEQLLETGSAEREIGHVRKDGTTFPTWMTTTVLRDADRKPFGLLGIARDITDRKRAEDKLLQAKVELQQYVEALESSNQALEEFNHIAESATRAKSQFLANMSHEIRTPMTAILGYADLLLNEEGLEKAPPHRRQAFETIKRNGEHLLGLINDILDLSKVEAEKMEIQPVRCSPFELLTEVVSLMRVRADAKQLKLETDVAGLLPETVLTDPLRLRQVLVNLLGNAIKFTDQGEVRITARLVRGKGTVPFSASPAEPADENRDSPPGDSPRLRFDVTDTGIGMSDGQMQRLFQPFSQVDASASRRFGGSGLGLAISKRLVEALGGAIEVRSVPGQGSTFSVTIDPGPLDGIRMVHEAELVARPSAPSLASESAAAAAVELHARVLLVEDCPDNQRLISFVLKKAGADVTTVENGQLAVEAVLAGNAAGRPFDVILMDMQMPVMDGYAATRLLRAQGHAGPILAITAHAMADDRQKCLDAGCDDYLSKPIDRRQLLCAVAAWAGEPRASARG